jgi:hypothetical protein
MPEVDLNSFFNSAGGMGLAWLAIRQDVKMLMFRVKVLEDWRNMQESKKAA